MNEKIPIQGLIRAVLFNADGSVADVRESRNLIMTAGRQHYMNAVSDSIGGGSAPATTYSKMALSRTANAPAAPSSGGRLGDINMDNAAALISLTAGYPQVSDPDVDNTGSGLYILSWKGVYGAGVYTNTDISDVAITTSAAVYVGGGVETDALMMHAEFASPLNKTASQTLKVFVNHSFA